MTNTQVKNHPLYNTLCIAVGEQQAAKAVREYVAKQEKENQVSSEFSKDVKKIIIPNTMTKRDASHELMRQWEDEETFIDVDRSFPDWNWKDVLVAVKKVAEEHFGWVQGKTVWGRRPSEIEIVTDIVNGKKITETCFYGTFSVSSWEDADISVTAGGISAEVKKRYAGDVREFFSKIQTYLDTHSIYRGKSITVTEKRNAWGDVSLDFEIFELNVSDKIILNEDTERIIQNFVLLNIGDEGKRCYLFSGGYGNAKTETAMRIGGEGKKKGLAFFYCKDARVFHTLLKQAKNYQPCIVFLEDLDEIGAGEQRDADMNRILNTLDGVQTKGNRLTVIFTTNHEKRINPALRRPGRIDLVVKFDNPDVNSRAEIFKSYLQGIDEDCNSTKKDRLDYKKLAAYTKDVPGAVVAEIAKRGVTLCKKTNTCTMDLVKSAIDSMAHHLELMQEPVESNAAGNMVIAIQGAKISGVPLTEGVDVTDVVADLQNT